AASQPRESKQSATSVYRLEVATVATQTLNPVFGPHYDIVNGAITLKFRLDRRGEVHDLRVVSSISDRWIEETARRVIATAKFPPIPDTVIKELGHDSINIETVWIFKPSSWKWTTVTGAELFDYGTYQTV